ncbi:MAG: YihA family ribosome biogenesis GTP-binding protein [Rickettsiales bacterium]|nr:YihA family ribosome biogenesis GTP-binding protein [Rickettsiales bacterium]
MSEDWRFLKEVYSYKDLPNDSIPEFIFWGRSNVGKSSLINFLTKKKLAKTSKTPGRTRSLVFFQFKNDFRIVDFPGYGFSKINKGKIQLLDELIEKYLTGRKNLRKLFLLIDSRHGLKPIDILILELLEKIPYEDINIIFTKQDKLKSLESKKKFKCYEKELKKRIHKKIFHTSINNMNGILMLKKFLLKSINEKEFG